MVTVIIPIYNAELYLRRCLDSVLNSICQDFEVILVNDGSTDGSLEICREYAYKDNRVKLISQQNKGVSAARNRALEECRGEWVVFVDADDMIAPDFIGTIVQEKYHSQDLLLFDFSQTEEGLHRQEQAPQELHFDGEQVQQILKRTMDPHPLVKGGKLNLFSPWAKAFKSAIIHRHSIQFCTDLFWGEDTLFNIEYLLHTGYCTYIAKPAYYYAFYSESISRKFQPKLPHNLEKQLEKIRAALECSQMFLPLKKEFYFYVVDNLIYILIWSIFSPHNPASYKEKRGLCQEMWKNPLYCQAMKHFAAHDSLSPRVISRWIFCPFFWLRWYRMIALLCKPCYHYLLWNIRK